MSRNLVGDRRHYREIFNFHAERGKITREKLEEMFRLVQLNPTPEEKEKYFNIVFENRNDATFEDFIRLFSMRCVSHEYTENDIKKGFILLSDSDRRLRI